VYVNPFGSYNYYARKKSGYGGSKRVFTATHPERMDVHIKKVFKGQLKYRTIHLYDGIWIRRCPDHFGCGYTNTPREGWANEARYEGVSADGWRATFQYGPVSMPGMVWTGIGTYYSAEDWFDQEWRKLPSGGVQVDCEACTRGAMRGNEGRRLPESRKGRSTPRDAPDTRRRGSRRYSRASSDTAGFICVTTTGFAGRRSGDWKKPLRVTLS
jgi:hypothetical protein